MNDMPLRLTCADYARIMPLTTGAVRPEGVDLQLVLGGEGSWPARAEMLRRGLEDDSVAGGEASMGVHLRRIDQGDRSFVALPIFVLRNFTARDIYLRAGSGIRTPADLVGKRIGMYSWTASGSIWYRHFLTYIGIDPAGVQWCIGEVDRPYATRAEPTLPPGVTVPKPGRSLSDMLVDGELDAIYSPPRPERYHPVNGPLVRLFPDCRDVERAYYRETGVFPPQHLVVLRRAVWERDKTLARRITEAFVRCEDMFRKSIRSFPYASPWLDSDLEAMEAVMGDNPYAHGVEENRAMMEKFAEQGFHTGLTQRRVAVEDYFAEYLAS
jgi:4,5-dihydroxyphthalate decarboxylase